MLFFSRFLRTHTHSFPSLFLIALTFVLAQMLRYANALKLIWPQWSTDGNWKATTQSVGFTIQLKD